MKTIAYVQLVLLTLAAPSARAGEIPPDAQTCYQRSRQLGFAQRFDEALAWIDRGLEQAPADADLALWRVRLLGWSGHSREAIRSFDALVARTPEVMNDRENIQLAHDLRLWEEGDAQRDARVRLGVAPSFATSERGDELIVRTWALGRVVDTLRLGVANEYRARDYGDGTYLAGLLSYDAPTWTLEAEVGGALSGKFIPHLSASVEPSLRLSSGVWAHLRYWRIDFGDEGAHVVAPGLTVTLGDVELDARWWLGVHQDGSLSNAGLLRARWQFAPTLTAELGGGGGDASDYLDPQAGEVDGHWLALAGLRWQPTWRHRVFLGYALRDETVGPAEIRRHEISFAYAINL